MKLQKIYSVDIEMFGYPRQPYWGYGSNEVSRDTL